jgi:hypothetical protein
MWFFLIFAFAQALNHEKIQQDLNQIQEKLNLHRSVNFTLYCVDPNRQYRENHPGPPYYGIPLTYGLGGYYEYQRDGPRYRYATYEERFMETELIEPRPYCEPNHGYNLYQRLYGNLDDTPQAYTYLFFQKLNTRFPNIRLTVSNHRPSEGLYDSDCCPLFTVSW